MKKKFNLTLLTLLFFLATTSLPVSIHLCRMMEQVSAEECAMCALAKQEKSCCDSSFDQNILSIKKDTSSSCCSTSLVDQTVKENFLSVKNDLTQQKVLSVFISVLPLKDLLVNNNTYAKQTGFSSSSAQGIDLCLLNSILII